MMVIGRRVGERLLIGEGIVIEVIEIRGRKVRLGVQADRAIPVDREEVYLAKQSGRGGGDVGRQGKS